MPGVDTRNISRDSLLLVAEVRLDGDDSEHRVKVRNLSSGGMMAEGGPTVVRGKNVSVNLRNIGPVDGVIAWIEEGRFGIAFSKEIDAKLARAPVGSGDLAAPRFTRSAGIDSAYRMGDPKRMRTL